MSLEAAIEELKRRAAPPSARPKPKLTPEAILRLRRKAQRQARKKQRNR